MENRPPGGELNCPVCGTRAPRDTEFCASCGSPLVKADDADEDIAPGTVLDGQFRIDTPIGRGGMGTVYKGYDTKLRRLVAVKVLPSRFHTDRELVDRFQREALAVAAIDHPNIIPIYAVGTAGGIQYFVMRLIQGTVLSKLLRAGPMNLSAGGHIILQACDALGAIHRAGGVHRDVKSSNIMVDADGNMTLLDFGILRGLSAIGGTMTQTGNIVGTPHYMSPEQVRSSKDLDHRSDLYSLGIVMYEVFTGRLPFLAKNVFDILSMHANVAPESPLTYNPMLPEAVAEVILRAIEKDRDNRYQSAAELKEALASAVPETGRWQSFSTGVFKAPPTNERPKVVLSRSLLGTAEALGPTEAAGPTQVAPGAALVPPTATGLSGFYGESQLQLTRRRRRQWIGASVVAAVVIGVGSFVALKGDDKTPKTTSVGSDSRAEAQSRKGPDPRPAPAAAKAAETAHVAAPATAPTTATAPARAPSSAALRLGARSESDSRAEAQRRKEPPPASARPRAEKRARDVEPATLSVGVVEGDEPSSGVLLVNGKRHGEVPGSFQLAPGKTYRLEIAKKGYRSFSRKVKLKGGEEKNITFKVERVEP